jgi:hypothetical protein
MKPGPIGIHLGEDRIKIAQVAEEGSKIEIIEMISLPTPKGAISGGFIKTPRIVAEEINNAVSAVKFNGRKAVIAIPSEILQISIISVSDTSNVDAAIAAKISQMSFERPQDMAFDYKILSKTRESIRAIVAITNKNHVQTIKEVVTQAKLILLGNDLEMLSIFKLVSYVYQTEKKPVIIALFSGASLKLGLFFERVLSSIKTTELETPRAMLDPKQTAIEIARFVDDYRRLNLITEEPVIFLAGLPQPSFTIEKSIREVTGLITTSVRWSQAFGISQTYTDFMELRNRFGAYSCAIGLSLADLKLPQKIPAPIIADPGQDGFKHDMLNFFNTED